MSKCPLCRTAVKLPSFKKNGFDYNRCQRCHSIFVDAKIADATIHQHYGISYYESVANNDEGRQGYPSYRESQKTLTDGFQQKLRLVRKYVPGGRLLDAGAAYGYFLKASEPFFKGEGIDVSRYAAMVARREFRVNVIEGDIEKTNFPVNYFDAVVMWDIIEHIIRPIKALQEVKRILKPGGFLFVSTDDAACWLPKILGKNWWALAAPFHLCHFSKKGLIIACESVGFEQPEFHSDRREYTIPEIVKHFGVSYENTLLNSIGMHLQNSPLKKGILRIARPEQFIAAIKKPKTEIE